MANWACGWAPWTVVTIEPISDFTLSIAGPMLPVSSTTRTMSGLGGISGVLIVLVTWTVSPGSTDAS